MFTLFKRVGWKIYRAKVFFSNIFMLIVLGRRFKGINFMGIPEIEITNKNNFIVGNNITLNSLNKYYHIAMYSPVKLIANTEKSIIIIGDNTRIHGSCIHAKELVSIGKNVLVAANCNIY